MLVLPAIDAVIVHLGKTDAAVRDRLLARLRRLIAASVAIRVSVPRASALGWTETLGWDRDRLARMGW